MPSVSHESAVDLVCQKFGYTKGCRNLNGKRGFSQQVREKAIEVDAINRLDALEDEPIHVRPDAWKFECPEPNAPERIKVIAVEVIRHNEQVPIFSYIDLSDVFDYNEWYFELRFYLHNGTLLSVLTDDVFQDIALFRPKSDDLLCDWFRRRYLDGTMECDMHAHGYPCQATIYTPLIAEIMLNTKRPPDYGSRFRVNFTPKPRRKKYL